MEKREQEQEKEQETKKYKVEWQSNEQNFTETVFCSCSVVAFKIFKNSEKKKKKQQTGGF